MRNIGLDIGGTSIKGAVVEDKTIIKMTKRPTSAKNGMNSIINAICACIDDLLPFIDSDGKIGIGSAGNINPYNGKVIYATGNLPGFTGLELKKIIEDKYKREVSVINDAVSGLIGELVYGAGINRQNVVMITLGTGLGGGILARNKLLIGDNCRAARLGHTILYPDGRSCNCGEKGCAEQYVSATGLLKTAEELGLTERDCTTIFKMAYEKLPIALKVVERFLKDLSIVVNNLFNIFDPEIFIIGGGLVESKEYWWELFLNLISTDRRNRIRPALLGNKAGFYGSQYLTHNKNFLL